MHEPDTRLIILLTVTQLGIGAFARTFVKEGGVAQLEVAEVAHVGCHAGADGVNFSCAVTRRGF